MKNTRKHILLSFAVLMMTMTACGQVNDDKTESRKSSASSNVDSSSSESDSSLSSSSDSSKSDSKTTTTTTASKATSSVTTTSIVTVTDAKGNLLSKISIDENGKVINLDKDGKPKTTTKKTTSKTGSTSSSGTATTTRKTTSGGGSSTSYTSNSGNNNSGGYSNGNSGSSDNSYSNNNNNSGNSGNSGNNNSSSNNNQQQQTEQQTQAPEPEPQKEYYDVCGFLLDNWCPENYGLAGAKIVGGSYDESKCYDVACELYEKNKSIYERGLSLINQVRSEAGVSPLELDKNLCIAATMRSLEQDFVTGMSHTRPNGSQIKDLICNRFSSIGSSDNLYGENCCEGAYDIDSAVEAWKDSPAHYANMVYSEYTKIGLGLSKYMGIEYWTTVFEGEIDWDQYF